MDAFRRGFLDELEKCSGFFKDVAAKASEASRGLGTRIIEKVKEKGPGVAKTVVQTGGNVLEGVGSRAVGGLWGAIKGAAKGAYKGI